MTAYTHLATICHILLRNVASRIFYQRMTLKYIMAQASLRAESFIS